MSIAAPSVRRVVAGQKSPKHTMTTGNDKPASRAKRTKAHASDARKSSMLHIRLDNALKDDAERAFDAIGISLPEAIRVFLKRVVRDGAFPFRLEVPNAETATALRESRATEPKTFATATELFDDLAKRRDS